MKLIEILKSVSFSTFKEWAAYRSHMVLSLIIGPLFFLVQYFIWSAVFANQETVNGFTFSNMIGYFGIVILLHYLTMDFADWNLQMLIRTGKFTTFILRPVSHRFFALSQKLGHRFLGLILEFIPVYLIFLLFFKIPLVPAAPLWFALSLAFSFLLTFFFNYCVGLTGFWLIRTDGLREFARIMRNLMAGIFVPLNFFPAVVQQFLFFLPFQFIAYVPIRVFLGSYQLGDISLPIPHIVGLQGIMTLLMYFLSEFLWHRGIKKFTGAGA